MKSDHEKFRKFYEESCKDTQEIKEEADKQVELRKTYNEKIRNVSKLLLICRAAAKRTEE